MNTKKQGWTPGPWKAQEYTDGRISIITNHTTDNSAIVIADMVHTGREMPDARLIAAAPLMVEALKNAPTPRYTLVEAEMCNKTPPCQDCTYTEWYYTTRKAPAQRILPSLCDVLYSLSMDAEVLNAASFEYWAQELGYDTDSRKAEATYRLCLSIALAMNQFIDLDELREVVSDY